MDLLYQQAQENFPKILKELVEKPDFEAFIKAQSKEEFTDTFFGLMKVFVKYQEFTKPQEIPEVANDEIVKMTEKIFEKIGSGQIVPDDIIKVITGNSTEEELIELGKKFYDVFPGQEEDLPAGSSC